LLQRATPMVLPRPRRPEYSSQNSTELTKSSVEQLASHPPLDRTPDEETEAAYSDIVGGLSLALGQTFKILHSDLKNPQTQHWDEARAVFDLLL
ncbi:DUF1931 family protein, partial [Streptomyces sp. NPDC004250]|uniref:DUF1931 family protein n=1 Tax=Streptomyces sp. NPDC004250 TaxID=3364692 RepID=UPI00368F7D3F